jgi:DNA repair exonuclease SbcCD nuclease subunit
MKFAHMADCHLGGWREQKIQAVNILAFENAIDIAISNNVDFVIISGDLFNTSLPAIEIIKDAVSQLKRLKEKNIAVYAVAGSHDFSPSGKTMIDVLEKADLLFNVGKGKIHEGILKLDFTTDSKTGAKITGIPGRKGMLEKSTYEKLDYNAIEKVEGNKIFIFHTAIKEYLPGNLQIESLPLSFLPKNFKYYAGGHVHTVFSNKVGNSIIAMPGPVFPNNFKELEELKFGGMFIVEWNESIKTTFVPIVAAKVISMQFDCTAKSPERLKLEILERLRQETLDKAIVLLRISGTLEIGKITEIDFSSVYDIAYSKGALHVMRNTAGVHIREIENQKVDLTDVDDIEAKIIESRKSNIDIAQDEKKLVVELMNIMSAEKEEGETKTAFEERMLADFELLMKKYP